MVKRSKRTTYSRSQATTAGSTPASGLLELERFSESSLERWGELSADLDELQDTLYFNLEPERRRRRPDIIKALQKTTPSVLDLQNWVRIVDYRWTLHPISAAGSLTSVGGRFNAGIEIDGCAFEPWPSLYVASDYATAFREKFQLQPTDRVDGLAPGELALCNGQSHTTVFLDGKLSRVFELTPATLDPVARVLGRIKMPARAAAIRKKLKIRPGDLRMLARGKQLYEVVALHNWRVQPIQFGLPSQSQILSELIRAAGFEAISYKSSKGGGTCLAVFVDRLAPESFIEIAGQYPADVTTRLDEASAEKLAGWSQLGIKRPSHFPN